MYMAYLLRCKYDTSKYQTKFGYNISISKWYEMTKKDIATFISYLYDGTPLSLPNQH